MDKELGINTKETSVSKETLTKIKEELLIQKTRILAELKNISKKDSHESDNRAAQFPEYGDKPDENAQEINDFATTIVAQKLLEKSLDDINKSIKRIDNGTYGTCKYCGKIISEKRLMARPTAGACVACKTELQENE